MTWPVTRTNNKGPGTNQSEWLSPGYLPCTVYSIPLAQKSSARQRNSGIDPWVPWHTYRLRAYVVGYEMYEVYNVVVTAYKLSKFKVQCSEAFNRNR